MKSLILMTSASAAALTLLFAAGCESSEPLGPTVCSTTEAVDPAAASSASASPAEGTPAPKEIVEPVYFDQAPVASAQPAAKASAKPEPKPVAKAGDKPVVKVDDKPAAKAASKPTEPAKAAASPQPKSIPQPVVINEPLATRPALAPAPDAKKLRTYSIQKGDTLYGISRKFYNGDASRYKDIIRANPGVNPDRLLVGTTLNIP